MTTTDPVVHDVGARRWRVLGYALLALLAYVPVLLTKPGKVVADTKSYLYLDPGRLLERAFSMWDPHIGMGTVTHQTIGYLWPLGPYYWLTQHLAVPDWMAQRLWLGSLLFAAGTGVVYLLRTWRVSSGTALTVAAFAYALSPYALDYAARISVILMPWAGLPWLIAFMVRSLRGPTWRWPAPGY